MFLANKLNKGGSLGGYQISRSLRFNRADSAYLNRTPASTGSRTTFTLSLWLKLGSFATGNDSFIWSSGDAITGNPIALLWKTFSTNYYFNITGTSTELVTTALFRDPSAWYHVVLAFDTTQATSTNRIKMYVNGVQVTSFTTATYPAQNFTYDINTSSYPAYLGCLYASGFIRFWEGYQTEVNFTDGTQLTPSSFGETNAQTGVWQPKAYSGSYGTNGFYLNFSDNSNTTAATLGKDYSGNGNNWTPNNFSVTAGVGNDSLVDSPTAYGFDTGLGGTVRGNYCTLNPLVKVSFNPTLTNGNLDLSAISQWSDTIGTIGVTSGKWYWEVVCGNSDAFIGICGSNADLSVTNPQNSTGTISYLIQDGTKRIDGTSSAYGAAATTETIGVALDIDGGTVTFYKSNTSQGSISLSSSTLNGKTIFPFFVKYASTMTVNFGQRPFAYTAPSGFKALCTQNLPTPTIGATTATQAGKFFNPILYTGDGTTPRSFTGVGFQPDFVWIKKRSTADGHVLNNAVAGVGSGKTLYSNLTSAEGAFDQYGYLASLNSDGFTTQAGATDSLLVNASGATYVAWNWKANGAGSTNTSGSITSTVSANTTSGFSVVTYTGTGGASTVGHGLGVAPSMFIVKVRNDTNNWPVYHKDVGATNWILLNTTGASASNSAAWNNTAPTSTVFTVGTSGATNQGSMTYVAYCFAPVSGYSAFGSYTANASTDGPFVYCGFRPKYVMFKRSSVASNWAIHDNARDPYNTETKFLFPNDPSAEVDSSSYAVDFVSNGFKIRSTGAETNQNSGEIYIFAAFAETPFKYSLAR